jgi:hypothetical protein
LKNLSAKEKSRDVDWRERNKDRLQTKHQKFMKMRHNRESQILNALTIHKNFARAIQFLIRQKRHLPAAIYSQQIMTKANYIYTSLTSIEDIKKSGTPCFPRKASLRVSITTQRMTT